MIWACICSTFFNVVHLLKIESKVCSFAKLLLLGTSEEKKAECFGIILEKGSERREIFVLSTELR